MLTQIKHLTKVKQTFDDSWPGDLKWSQSPLQSELPLVVLESLFGIRAFDPFMSPVADYTNMSEGTGTWKCTRTPIPGCTNP